MNRKPAVCALAAVLWLGAMGLSGASDLLERSYISIEALSLGPGFQKVLAEEGLAETILRAVIRDMGIPGEALESTKYSYNYMEEEDGKREALVLLTRENGRYEGVNEGKEIEDISQYRGSAFFANDFILDNMTGRYRTLEGK